MKKIYILVFGLISLVGQACKEEFNRPLEENGSATATVSNVTVKNTPGGAILTYNLPGDANLLYAVAEVETKNGKMSYFKSSAYKDKIEIIGLPDEKPRTIKVFTVNKSEVKSAPVEVTINPLTPPYLHVLRNLKMAADFGGVNIQFKNETEADLAFTLERLEPDGNYRREKDYYSRLKAGSYTFRGIEAEEAKFALYVRDRWENISDTLYATLTPLYEMKLDKSKFRDLTLDGDSFIYTDQWHIAKRYAWDDTWSSDFNNPYGNWLNVTTNEPNNGQPTHITIDLGVKAKLSRFRINHYYRFIDRGMKRYEIWGRSDQPKDGSWDGWTKMISYEQKKPSGLSGESYTAADKEVWLAGDNGDFPAEIPAVRYIRVKCLENWVGTTNLNFAEITFWGSDKY
ncbi:DUF5126 domain-containing protein [Sphingobacterium puteale]|uniref:DUF5126 domain-containing protein n=1 Tax=Sphingobacterium puteale TaxID=2420510 RepID=A0A420W4A6_9SPHI|nr:DUF5000 domain-containing lipoprotein [Sphingobacterium puteale]RKO73403.1 DUF5126 domain-containing protein [Sphingobacterium puteale]